MYSQNSIDRVLNQANIVEIISEHSGQKMKRQGNGYVTLCPFHDDHKPSLSISEDKGLYHCFSCGASGNIITYLKKMLGMSFEQVIENLAQKYNVSIEKDNNYDPEHKNILQSYYEVLKKVNDYYQANLNNHPLRKEAADYIDKRAIPPQIQQEFQLGFCPNKDSDITSFFQQNEIQALVQLGVLKLSENGHYSFFSNRLMFPIHDVQNRVVGFGARAFTDQQKPKYLNSSDSEIFKKSQLLYNLNKAIKFATKFNYLIVVEGYMDVIGLHKNGIENVVASSGTAMTPENLKQAFRYFDKVILCFDGDEAGEKAANKALMNYLPLLDEKKKLNFILLSDGLDPEEYIETKGKEEFEKLVYHSTPLSYFITHFFTSLADKPSAEDKTQYIHKILELIKLIPAKNKVFIELLIQELTQKTAINIKELFLKEDKKEKNNRADENNNPHYNSTFPSNSTKLKPNSKQGRYKITNQLDAGKILLYTVLIDCTLLKKINAEQQKLLGLSDNIYVMVLLKFLTVKTDLAQQEYILAYLLGYFYTDVIDSKQGKKRVQDLILEALNYNNEAENNFDGVLNNLIDELEIILQRKNFKAQFNG